jgi:hypothetical protein
MTQALYAHMNNKIIKKKNSINYWLEICDLNLKLALNRNDHDNLNVYVNNCWIINAEFS